MSVRIHVISKQTGVPSKELIAILKKRGYQVSTASSSIDPISAEALIEELGSVEKPPEEKPPIVEAKPKKSVLKPPTPPTPTKTPLPTPPAPTPPAPPPLSAFVRSKEEIAREKEKKRRPIVIPPPPTACFPDGYPPSASRSQITQATLIYPGTKEPPTSEAFSSFQGNEAQSATLCPPHGSAHSGRPSPHSAGEG